VPKEVFQAAGRKLLQPEKDPKYKALFREVELEAGQAIARWEYVYSYICMCVYVCRCMCVYACMCLYVSCSSSVSQSFRLLRRAQ
jgi:putative exporter of polyketide antibiotics